ncbi:MAG TPA: glycosyltransferase family 4 protein, partial [Acidimicrobiales bacterium]
RLEQRGVRIRLHVLRPPDEDERHPVVDRVAAPTTYLPPTTSLSSEPLVRWLRANLRPFLPALGRTARRHPLRLARAAAAAAAQAVRARKGWRPRKVYAKELLQAVAVADAVDRAGDVVHLHAHFAHGATTVAWLASMLTGLPFSFTGHAKDLYEADLNPAGLLARKARAAAFVATCTAANAAHLRAVAPGAPVHLVYHGLNADFARLLPAAAPARRPDRFRVVAVGRRVAKKGFDVVLDAVADLRDRGLDLEAVLAGEPGPEDAAVAERVARHGLHDVVRVLGPLDQAGLVELYRGASAFTLACRVVASGDRDGIPNVMVEAMAAGLPVVTTAVSGIPELVADGVNGLLVPPDDPAALADALWRVAKDPALAARLAEAGRATVADRFDGDVLAGRMADLLVGAGR